MHKYCIMENQYAYQSFTELEAWKLARELKIEIYNLITKFPKEERYNLTDQLIRAARSVCSNISEGHGRYSYKDQLHFCVQARGSLSEVNNHLIDALDCNYIDTEKLSTLEGKIAIVRKVLNGYISFLRNSGNGK